MRLVASMVGSLHCDRLLRQLARGAFEPSFWLLLRHCSFFVVVLRTAITREIQCERKFVTIRVTHRVSGVRLRAPRFRSKLSDLASTLEERLPTTPLCIFCTPYVSVPSPGYRFFLVLSKRCEVRLNHWGNYSWLRVRSSLGIVSSSPKHRSVRIIRSRPFPFPNVPSKGRSASQSRCKVSALIRRGRGE